MLMEKLNRWKCEQGIFGCEMDQNLFGHFVQETFACQSWLEMFATLAYEIYELQVCVEGLIEDQELPVKHPDIFELLFTSFTGKDESCLRKKNGQENQKTKKEN